MNDSISASFHSHILYRIFVTVVLRVKGPLIYCFHFLLLLYSLLLTRIYKNSTKKGLSSVLFFFCTSDTWTQTCSFNASSLASALNTRFYLKLFRNSLAYPVKVRVEHWANHQETWQHQREVLLKQYQFKGGGGQDQQQHQETVYLKTETCLHSFPYSDHFVRYTFYSLNIPVPGFLPQILLSSL